MHTDKAPDPTLETHAMGARNPSDADPNASRPPSEADVTAPLQGESSPSPETGAMPDSLAGPAIPDVTAEFDSGTGTGSAAANSTSEPTPEQIGSYRIVREIGRGGMGQVLLGVSDEDTFRRKRAIKLIKRGMDTEDVLQRFELERQLLDTMNHPGIARSYEAGQTEDGRPYIVMEHVEGLELLEYCATNRLTIDERLTLFSKICDAVHYAHTNLVVHRDLKPGNVLVTQDGQPKLLDFGIAKIINPDLALQAGDPTAPEMRVLTPEYASPEQVRGHAVTTASDVYSLGVIMYEMLTGQAPYSLKSRIRSDVERVVCDEDPDRPSTVLSRVSKAGEDGKPSTRRSTAPSTTGSASRATDRLRRRLAGDLDNIVLMAMRKEPHRRYPSAQELAADIRRHQKGMPVVARPDTFSYRASKFMRRHRSSVAAAILITISLVAGLAGTATGMVQAEEQRDAAQDARDEAVDLRKVAEAERDRAEQRFNALRSLAHTFMFDVHDAIATLEGSIPARRLLVETARDYLNDLHNEVGDRPDLNTELAAGYERIGDIMGGRRSSNLGAVTDAIEMYRSALDLRRALHAAAPDDLAAGRALAMSHHRLAAALQQDGQIDLALAHHRDAVAVGEEIARSNEPRMRRGLAIALGGLSSCLVARGDEAGALAAEERALVIYRELVEAGESNLSRSLGVKELAIGGRKRNAGDLAAAEAHYERAERIRRTAWEMTPQDGRARRDLAWALYFLADVRFADERLDEARAPLAESVALFRQRVADSQLDARALGDLPGALEFAGRLAEACNELETAEAHFTESVAILKELTSMDGGNALHEQVLATAQQGLARVREARGDEAGAFDAAGQALATMEAVIERSSDARYPVRLAGILTELGAMHHRAGSNGDALRYLDRAVSTYDEILDVDPEHRAARIGKADASETMAIMMFKLTDLPAALKHARASVELSESPIALRYWLLARACLLSGDRDGAHAAAEAGLRVVGEDDEETRAGLKEILDAS